MFWSIYKQIICFSIYISCVILYSEKASEMASKKQKPNPSWFMKVVRRIGKASYLISSLFNFFRLCDINYILDAEYNFMWPAYCQLVVVHIFSFMKCHYKVSIKFIYQVFQWFCVSNKNQTSPNCIKFKWYDRLCMCLL